MRAQDTGNRGKLFDWPLTRRLLAYSRKYRVMLGLGVLIILLTAVVGAFLPILSKTSVDSYLLPHDSALSAAERTAGIVRIVMLYAALAVLVFFLRYAESYLMAWTAEHIVYEMRADIYAKILRLPLRYMDRTPVGQLMTRVTSDVDAMQRMVTDGLVGLVADLISLAVILGFMLYLSPLLTLVLLFIAPILLVIMGWINRNARSTYREVRSRLATMNAYLQEMITGMLTIQMFNREKHVKDRFDKKNRTLREAWVEAVHWNSLFFPSMELLSTLSVGLLLGIGGLALLAKPGTITVGLFVAFLAYLGSFFRPLQNISEKTIIFQSAMASSERIFALLDEPEDVSDPEHPVAIDPFRGEVEFDRVSFAYADEDWVLQDVSFRIAPGESVAIVGATGAGKTTIINLISRFYDAQKGCVKVDGRNVREYRQVDLHRRIGLVMQDPFVFSGTIASNIGMNNPAITREQIVDTARRINAHHFIEKLPDGYDTCVQERGITLSTGQKQLLALARALVQNPDILLILDEATANVDTESEQMIQAALERLMRGRTSIIIAHRLSTIRGVDRIIVMRQGRKTEEGSHAELIRREDGYYRLLYELLAHQPA